VVAVRQTLQGWDATRKIKIVGIPAVPLGDGTVRNFEGRQLLLGRTAAPLERDIVDLFHEPRVFVFTLQE